MKEQFIRSATRSALVVATSLICATGLGFTSALAKGGSSTPSAPAVVESRVTGFVGAIDRTAGTISIGASYYGSSVLKVTANTKIQINRVSVPFSEVKVGDWVEARYIATTREATKLEVTR